MKKFVIFLLLCALALSLALAVGLLYFLTPPETNNNSVVFTVNDGESVETIATRLEHEGIIRSALSLRILSKLAGTESTFKKGYYNIPAGLDALAIHQLLITGQQKLVRITIPDGFTLSKTARLFDQAGISSEEEFLAAATDPEILKEFGISAQSVEGFLFPDTYFFAEHYPAKKILRHLIEQFFRELETIVPDYRNMPMSVLEEKIILASIIEREYVNPLEAPLMASVFTNRMTLGKRLESCATVVYIITEIEKKEHPSRIFYRDLERDSPFNTYRYSGLPPGPISNPGRIALNAAFNPASTDYLYFVLKDPNAKEHQFSRTFAEHERASEIYFKK